MGRAGRRAGRAVRRVGAQAGTGTRVALLRPTGPDRVGSCAPQATRPGRGLSRRAPPAGSRGARVLHRSGYPTGLAGLTTAAVRSPSGAHRLALVDDARYQGCRAPGSHGTNRKLEGSPLSRILVTRPVMFSITQCRRPVHNALLDLQKNF